jgi:molecular chaperone HtpG
LSSSPFIEALKRKGMEAFYMCEPIDEYAVQQLRIVRWREVEVWHQEGSGSDVDPIDEYAVQQLKELTEEDEVCPQY